MNKLLNTTAFGAFLDGYNKEINKPTIVCLCGSTKFADLHAIARWELEKTGKYICLMINYLPESYCKAHGLPNEHHGEHAGVKDVLDELHKRKIDLADIVFIINKDGYIGKSTHVEIIYAMEQKKKIVYLEDVNF